MLSAPTPVASDRAAVVHAGLRWLVDGAPRDAGGMWLSPDLGSSEHASLKLVSGFRVYRSANRGVAGVVYALARAHRMGFAVAGAADAVGAAADWLLAHAATPDDQMVGLHFGEAGVAVALAEAVAAGLIDTGPWTLPYTRQALSGTLDWPDLSHGAAGQGMAAFLCADLLGEPALADAAHRCAEHLVATQEPDGAWILPGGVRAMEGVTYTGFAHGVAGIVAFLARYARRVDAPDAADAATRGGEWLLDQANVGRGATSLWFPVQAGGAEFWTWWCHGAPGVALGLLELFALTGDDEYAGAVRAGLRAHPVELRHPNLSQCHGVSGVGEVLLEAHRVLGDGEWRDRADAVGALLVELARTGPDGASWLVENPYTPTPDLMIGCGGVVHFLARLSTGAAPFSPPLLPEEPRP